VVFDRVPGRGRPLLILGVLALAAIFWLAGFVLDQRDRMGEDRRPPASPRSARRAEQVRLVVPLR
jgi:hypothetical protein